MRLPCLFLILLFSMPLRATRLHTITKAADMNNCQLPLLVGEDGFEPSKRNATDLQSAPFDRSGTLPYLVLIKLDYNIITGR